VKDGLVYKQKARLKDAGHVQPQLLLPRSEVNRAIELCHAGSVGGHFGIEKTLKSSVDSIGLVGRMMSADIVAAVSNVPNTTGVNFLSTEHYNPSYPEHPTSVGILI